MESNMYDDLIEILENGLDNYCKLMSENEFDIISEAISEVRNPSLNKRDLRNIANRSQRIIFSYSRDEIDLDELIGY